ncbi:hypothetical protein PTKIN_Ptkin12aG0101000 [Pterospermum kingtungense]
MAREVLPQRDALCKRGIFGPTRCVFCNGAIENSSHLFLDCAHARSCWDVSGLAAIVYGAAADAQSFVQWYFSILCSVQGADLDKIFMILWSSRQRSYGLRLLPLAPPPPHHPRSSSANSDAATFVDSGEFGMGMLLRDDKGRLIAYKMLKFAGLPKVKECEALTLSVALSWIHDMGLRLEPEPTYKVSFVRRKANVVAHVLARKSRYVVTPTVCYDVPAWLRAPLRALCTSNDR